MQRVVEAPLRMACFDPESPPPVGARVRINTGVLDGHTGEVIRLDSQQRMVHYRIKIFGRPTELEADYAGAAKFLEILSESPTMLEGLDRVDWASLEHAYGSATAVPDLLRSLLSAESDAREDAINDLFGNIWHQGTVYTATAAAVPFLYELLTAADVQNKSMIACLLASIADGVGYLEVHATGELGEPTWRKILDEKGKTLEDELAQEAAVITSVRRAASAGLRHLSPYLNDDEPEIRRSVATALGNYPEHESWAQPAIEIALASETDEDVREALAASKARRTK